MQQNIEAEYQKLVEHHDSVSHKSKETGVETVLRFLYEQATDKPQKVWWWSWEFIGKTNYKGGYLSHRAPARASDLAIHFSNLVEHRKIGRFAVYRIRMENEQEIKDFLKE